jgi:hypothetical protein
VPDQQEHDGQAAPAIEVLNVSFDHAWRTLAQVSLDSRGAPLRRYRGPP